MDTLLKPTSVAVIGASRKPGKVGYEVLNNIIKSGFKGKIYPINPKADKILGFKCYSSVLDVNTNIDLGIIVVPAQLVPMIVNEIGEKGIKNIIIISAGFRESGLKGAKLEKNVVNICKQYKIRLLGPNCLGFINTLVPINASFAPYLPIKGNIAFISQSGALGTAILDWALEERIGFSVFVSLGNKADINETDLIQTLMDDVSTKVILIYFEGLKNGQNFLKVAKLVSKKKPIVVLKSGSTSAGARAVSSHTGSMAGSDLAYNVAFKSAGIIRVKTIENLFDLAEVFATQPIPVGANIAIITNAGGPGIVATDACERYGLKIATIPASIVEKLRQKLPSAAGFFNPIDVLGDATADRYKLAIESVLESEDVHSALIILTPQAMTEPNKTAKAIIDLRKKFPEKPIATSFLGGKFLKDAIKKLEKANIPNYKFPERAIHSLSALYNYQKYKTFIPSKPIPKFNIDYKTIESILQKAKNERRVILNTYETAVIAQSYGIPAPPTLFATTAEESVLKAEKIGYPVALKIESPQILHKTDLGGVKLNIRSANEVRTSFYELIGRAHMFSPKAIILGVIVQKMIAQGKEMIIGMNRDMTFGPLIMFGLGGIYVNFFKDVAFQLAPLSYESAIEMLQETKAYTLLRGIRGESSSDIDSVVDVMLRLSQLVTDFTEITEIDINPLFVYEKGKGCSALDIKMTIKTK